MTDTTPIVFCKQCRTFWAATGDEPLCSDSSHSHAQTEIHRHRAAVLLPGGTQVVAVSFDFGDPYSRADDPHFGLYLDERWSPPWSHAHVDWPDFGVPVSAAELTTKLANLLERSRIGERVEMGCFGAHGRTGTALACLAILDGLPASDAVDWVRRAHCERAIETQEQIEFVSSFAAGG